MDQQDAQQNKQRRLSEYAWYCLAIFLFAPPALIWIGGFFFGEGVAYMMPNWFGIWFMFSLAGMCLFLAVNGTLAKSGVVEGNSSWGEVVVWLVLFGVFSFILWRNL